MPTPIDKLLDDVKWEKVKYTENPQRDHELPYVTHEGKLKIASLEIEVVLLNNGQRIVTEDGLLNFMQWMENGGTV